MQRLSNRFRDLALDCEDISQFSIERFSPQVRVSNSVDELHIHPHLIAGLLHAALQNVGDAKLLRDLGKIVRRAFEVLCRGARNDF